MGFSIILHCFDYNNRARKEQIEQLEKYCNQIHIYRRKKSIFFLLSRLPFIVRSRRNKLLLYNLLKNDYPILFEGIHTTAFLSHSALKYRNKILRTHNIESDYYGQLGKSTNHFFKKLFYQIESRKLKRYEPSILSFAQKVLTISEHDKRFFKKLNPETEVLMPSIDFEKKSDDNKIDKKFILFHGNLSVEENEKAAFFLLEKVFSKIEFPVIIAGKKPSLKLKESVAKFSHIRLVQSPNELEMQNLIAAAHIHVLFSFQGTGVKLKLMNVLQNGRFCVANNAIIGDLPVEELLSIANTSEEILTIVKRLMSNQFDEKQWEHRELFLTNIAKENEIILKYVFTNGQ